MGTKEYTNRQATYGTRDDNVLHANGGDEYTYNLYENLTNHSMDIRMTTRLQ